MKKQNIKNHNAHFMKQHRLLWKGKQNANNNFFFFTYMQHRSIEFKWNWRFGCRLYVYWLFIIILLKLSLIFMIHVFWLQFINYISLHAVKSNKYFSIIIIFTYKKIWTLRSDLLLCWYLYIRLCLIFTYNAQYLVLWYIWSYPTIFDHLIILKEWILFVNYILTNKAIYQTPQHAWKTSGCFFPCICISVSIHSVSQQFDQVTHSA